MVATLIIAAVAVLRICSRGPARDAKREMVWRGEQYERAIGLMTENSGSIPPRLKTSPSKRMASAFLRQAYTDPMNKEDGSWRFIYVPEWAIDRKLRVQVCCIHAFHAGAWRRRCPLGRRLQPLAPPGTARWHSPRCECSV